MSELNREFDEIRQCLIPVTAVYTMQELVPRFQEFVESVIRALEKFNLIEINDKNQSQCIFMTLLLFHRSIVIFCEAMQNYVKYPLSCKAKEGQKFGTLLMQKALTSLSENMWNHTPVTKVIATVDEIVELLSANCQKGLQPKVTVLIQTLVQFSSVVQEHILKEECSELKILAKKTTEASTLLQEKYQNLKNSDSDRQASLEYVLSSERTMDAIEDLENGLKLVLFTQIAESLNLVNEPAESLVKVALDKEKIPNSELDNLIKKFEDHWDRISRISKLAAACSYEAKRFVSIHLCNELLENIAPQFISAVVGLSSNPTDRGSIGLMRILWNNWRIHVHKLAADLDGITEPQILLPLVWKSLEDNLKQIEGSDVPITKQNLQFFYGGLDRCITLAVFHYLSSGQNQQLDALVKHLQESLLQLKSLLKKTTIPTELASLFSTLRPYVFEIMDIISSDKQEENQGNETVVNKTLTPSQSRAEKSRLRLDASISRKQCQPSTEEVSIEITHMMDKLKSVSEYLARDEDISRLISQQMVASATDSNSDIKTPERLKDIVKVESRLQCLQRDTEDNYF